MAEPERIEIYIDESTVPAQVAPPFDLTLDTTGLADGEHTLRFVTRYADGQSRERRVSIVVRNHMEPLPEVSVKGLEDGGQVSGVIRATLVVQRPAPPNRGRGAWVLSSLFILAAFLGVWAVFALASLWLPPSRSQGTPQGASAGGGAAVSPGAIQAGAKQFAVQGCDGCHTITGTSARGTVGPNLTHIGAQLSRSGLEATVTHGKGGMPSFATIPQADLNTLLDYLQSLK